MLWQSVLEFGRDGIFRAVTAYSGKLKGIIHPEIDLTQLGTNGDVEKQVKNAGKLLDIEKKQGGIDIPDTGTLSK